MAGEIESITKRNLKGLVGFDANGVLGVRGDPLSKLMNGVAALGDSRISQIFSDWPSNRNRVDYAILPQALSQSGGRAFMVGNYGVAGDRVDQVWARLEVAVTSMAGTLFIHCGDVNDIGQAIGGGFIALDGPYKGQTITASNVAAFCANTILAMADYANANGMKVIIALGYGSGGFTAAQIGALLEFNERLRQGIDARAETMALDLFRIMIDPATSSPTALAYKSGYLRNVVGDVLVHPGLLGAAAAGAELATLFLTYMRPRKVLAVSATEGPAATGSLNLFANHFLTATTGGTTGGVVTGNIPQSFLATSTNTSGTLNCAATIGDAPDGFGKEIILTGSGGSGDVVQFRQDVSNSIWAAGDVGRFGARASLDAGSANVASIEAMIDVNVDGASTVWRDLYNDVTHGVYDNAKRDFVPVIERFQVPTFTTKGYLRGSISLRLAGSGSFVLRISRFQGNKVFS